MSFGSTAVTVRPDGAAGTGFPACPDCEDPPPPPGGDPPPPGEDPPPPPSGDEDFPLPLGEDEDSVVDGGWSGIGCTSATGLFEEVGCCVTAAASAVPPATAAAATPTAMAALTGLRWRRWRSRWMRCTVVLCTAGGALAGHS